MEGTCDILEGDRGVDIYLLHEFATSKESTRPLSNHFNNLGFTTINCEYPGHGSRFLEGLSWKGAIDELETLISERKNKAILVGISAGGSLAITLGSRNPGINKVFAISAPNRSSGYSRLGGERLVKEEERILPSLTASCKPGNKDRFFLIHAKNDSIVPISEFNRNKEILCLPEENTMVVNGLTGIGFLDHFALKNDESARRFIAERAGSI